MIRPKTPPGRSRTSSPISRSIRSGPATHQPRRPFGAPIAAAKPVMRFEPPPASIWPSYLLTLEAVMPAAAPEIEQSGSLVFHMVGNTGSVSGSETAQAIAAAMEAQIVPAPAGRKPAFLYHLGDVVCGSGQRTRYRDQFYEPFKYYPAPIFAIPGNQDGDTPIHRGDPPEGEDSLAGFIENFCNWQFEHLFPYRATMTQPSVFWTLEAPQATIIGLYSNVEGSLDSPGQKRQQQWLVKQFRRAPADRCLLVAVHHPPYSLDEEHGGSPEIAAALDQAIQAAGRVPDAVFSGHVHNYQRFTRRWQEREIPYVIAGAGGSANTPRAMHRLQRDAAGQPAPRGFATGAAGVILAQYQEGEPGFLRVTITGDYLQGDYFLVPSDGSPVILGDTFTLNWRTHRVN